jgi:hypothetical protein
LASTNTENNQKEDALNHEIQEGRCALAPPRSNIQFAEEPFKAPRLGAARLAQGATTRATN